MRTTRTNILVFLLLLFQFTQAYTSEDKVGVIVLPFFCESSDSILESKIMILSDMVREQMVSADDIFLANPWFGTDTLNLSFDEIHGRFLHDETQQLAEHTEALVVVSAGIAMRDSLARITLAAIELGSGISIAQQAFDIFIYKIEETMPLEPLVEAIGGIVAQILGERTAEGYPFASDEIGVLIVHPHDTSTVLMHWRALTTILEHELDSLDIGKLRAKYIIANFPKEHIYANAEDMLPLAQRLNARLLIFPEENITAAGDTTATVSFWSFDPRPANAAKTRIPLTPPQGGLAQVLVPLLEESDYILPASLLTGRLFYEAKQFEASANLFAMLDTMAAAQGIISPWMKFSHAQALHSFVRSGGRDSNIRENACREAHAVYMECLREMEQKGDSLSSAYCYLNMGDADQLQGEWQNAVTQFQKALNMFSGLHLVKEQLVTLNLLGGVFRYLGDWDAAHGVYRKTIAVAQETGDAHGLADALSNLGMLLELKQQPDSALSAYRESTKLRKYLGDEYGVSEMHGKICMVFRNIGQLDSAASHAQKQIDIGDELKSEPILAKGYFNQGMILRQNNDVDNAIAAFQSSLAQMEMMGDLGGMSRTLNNIGALHHDRGDTALALTYYHQSLQSAIELGDHTLITRCYTNIGDVYSDRKELASAVAQYDNAIAVAKENNDTYDYAVALFAKGMVHIKVGKIKDGYILVRRGVLLGESVQPEAFVKHREFMRRLEQLVDEP